MSRGVIMNDMNKLFKKIEGYRDEIIQLQSDLTSKVALGPSNGGTGEHEKAAYLKERLAVLKPNLLEEIKAPDERAADGYRPNLIAKWKGPDKSPTVWVLSHMDIVPPGDASLWESDPYEIRVEGDKIFGRGVEDNHHGIVSSLLAVKAILDSGLSQKNTIGLAMVADEETGSQFGLDFLLKKHRDLFRPEDLILVPDGGNDDGTMIEVSEKSLLWLRFTVVGRQCHASTPEKGKNSLLGAAKLILTLEKIHEQFDEHDDMFSPPSSTFAPTKMEANVPNINTIPGRDVFHLDCRILPKYRVDEIIDSAKKLAAGVAKELDLSIEVEPVYREDAAEPTSKEAPIVKSLSRAVKMVTGLDARPMGIGGGTVAAFFRKAGLQAAVWTTMPNTPHQPNEYCLINNIITDTKVMAALFMGDY
jgi:succinyl-diaminopimelate desuccinylase